MSERETTAPPHLWERLDAVESDLTDAGGLLLCSDFDGTLADITTDPAAPELSEEREALLAKLAANDDVVVTLVSGRALDDLADRADVEGMNYAGNHGVERLVDGDRDVPAAAPDREAITEAVDALRDRVLDIEGVHVEDKDLGLTIHYRAAGEDGTEAAGAGEGVEPRVRAAAQEVAEDVEGLDVHDGKGVYELRPAAVDKGSAVATILDGHAEDWLAVYVGDDVGDEAAFQAVRDDGLAILVGDRAETAADYRLEDPDDVESFLEWLATDGVESLR